MTSEVKGEKKIRDGGCVSLCSSYSAGLASDSGGRSDLWDNKGRSVVGWEGVERETRTISAVSANEGGGISASARHCWGTSMFACVYIDIICKSTERSYAEIARS